MFDCEFKPFTVNGYIFNKFLGSGTYSQVYLVHSTRYKQDFAAKLTVIDQSLVQRDGTIADSELFNLMHLNHPNIIRLYDYFVYDKFLVLVLDICTGGTLADNISTGTLTYQKQPCVKLMYDMLKGLEYCHEKKVAHRDIKPQNVFLDAYDRAILADFGLSKYISRLSQENIKCGSMNYVAPEVCLCAKYDLLKTDIWSLGVTFYEMMTGELPWTVDTPLEERDIMKISFPAKIDPNFRIILIQMLAKNPKNRPTVSEIMQKPFFKYPIPKRTGHSLKCLSTMKAELSFSAGPTVFSSRVSMLGGKALAQGLLTDQALQRRRKTNPSVVIRKEMSD